MLYIYKVTTKEGRVEEGSIDAASIDSAVASLQQRGFTIVTINEQKKTLNLFSSIRLSRHVPAADIVILSRQLATLFEAKVSVLNIFKLLAAESENENLREILAAIVDDLQAGTNISASMAKHPQVFAAFYVSMVKAGEESGKLSDTFLYLADYLERSFEITSKVRSALMYPAFVIFAFFAVMIVMFVYVIPQISTIIADSGQQLPWYTKIVLGASSFLVHNGIFLLVVVIILALALWQYATTKAGHYTLSEVKLSIPYVGALYRKLYLSRISDNMDTMLTSGISMLHALEISADVVDNDVYKKVLLESMELVKAGYSLSDSFSRYSEIPSIVVQMTKIGEETGKLGYVLTTISRFYKREVDNAINSIVSLIEPVMIVTLGIGVGFLLVSVLGPIYSVTSSF
jgi:type IV pilus assembly protein PilC